jgi:hypothetical protein
MGRFLFPDGNRDLIWRLNTISLADPTPSEFDASVYIKDARGLAFLNQNLQKTFSLDKFFSNNPIIVMDMFRDMYNVLVLDNGAHISRELRVMDYKVEQFLKVKEVISVYSPSYPDVWFESAKKFADIANRYKSTVLIVPIHCVQGVREKDKFVVPDKWLSFGIRTQNIMLSHLQSVMSNLIDNAFLLPECPEYAETYPDHEYGIGIQHLRPQYYRKMIQKFKTELASGRAELRHSRDERERYIGGRMQIWRDDARAGYGPQ